MTDDRFAALLFTTVTLIAIAIAINYIVRTV